MGWAAYKMTRKKRTTGEVLGEVVVKFPKVDVVISLPRLITITELVTIPDYPLEADVFAVTQSISYLKSHGINNIINLTEHQGEDWYMSNGWHISIGTETIDKWGGTAIYINWYDPEETGVFGGVNVSHDIRGRVDYFVYLSCLVGENQESERSMPYIVFTGSDAGNFVFPTEQFPEFAPRELQWFKDTTPIYETSDPYGDGGMTEPGGGTGTFDDTGDNIDIPALPTLSAVDTSFITLFAPTLAEMRNLANYMWSDLFDVNTWKKIFADPMQAILGLSIVPVNVPVSSTKPVKVGNISTDVYMGVASSQYIEVDCGTLDIKEFWGAYLDYDPYTKAEIYLPYIGTHPLAVDDIMGKAVHIVYHVDILSGACCAYVKCGGSVLYSFVGQCASSIPITGDNWTNVINGALSIAGSIGTMVATGGATAPMAVTGLASTAVNSFKPTVEKSGSLGGTGGMLGVQTPYLILTRPRQALPRDQNVFTGYPSFITENLADLTGYTEIEHIHLENVPATEPEISEIETLLKGGVIF